MQIDTSNSSNEKEFSNSIKIEEENIICKDGFCSLANQNEKPRVKSIDGNFFEPI